MNIDEIISEMNKDKWRIKRLQEKSDYLKESLMGGAIRYDSEPVDHSPSDKVCEKLSEAADIDAEIKRLKNKQQASKNDMQQAFSTLRHKRTKIMSMRYIEDKNTSEIAKACGISARQVQKMIVDSKKKLENF